MVSSVKIPAILLTLYVFFIQGTLGEEVVCEKMHVNKCSFAVDSSGKRCELYKHHTSPSVYELKCKASNIVAKKFAGHIETDKCVNACHVNRAIEGIRAEAFISPKITTHACVASCYENCPNIIDVFTQISNQDDDVGLKLISLCVTKGK